jgi:2-iminobutanoate/2-iminopropanoate deaminase
MHQQKWQPVDPGPGFKTPVGAYSFVTRANGFLFVSGQVPTDPATGEVQGEDIGAQTRYVISKLDRILTAAGSSLRDVVSVTAYLEDIADWDAFNVVYRESFSAPYPARTTVGAQLHGVLVEITAVAVAG